MPTAVGTFHDVVVDTSVFRTEQHFRLALETGKILISIGIICYQAFLFILATRGEVYHVLANFGVVDSLRRPHPVGIREILGIVLAQIHLGVFPVGKVVGLEHHDARICTPAVVGSAHVGGNHIECFAVGTTQDMPGREYHRSR